jgi:hypothetical protein
VCRIRCSVSEPDWANLIEQPPRGSKLLGWPGSESQREIPRSRGSDCQRSSIITQIIYLRLGYLM